MIGFLKELRDCSKKALELLQNYDELFAMQALELNSYVETVRDDLNKLAQNPPGELADRIDEFRALAQKEGLEREDFSKILKLMLSSPTVTEAAE